MGFKMVNINLKLIIFFLQLKTLKRTLMI